MFTQARAYGYHTASLTRWAKRVLHGLTDPYRPERHYMRGPGPKWRAKHAQHDIGAA
jgi:hypothetical protein